MNKLRRHFAWKYAHEGVVCLCCGTVLVSYYGHDYKTCGCEQRTMIDGGQVDYVRYGGVELSLVQHVLITPLFYTKSGKLLKKKLKTYREAMRGKT